MNFRIRKILKILIIVTTAVATIFMITKACTTEMRISRTSDSSDYEDPRRCSTTSATYTEDIEMSSAVVSEETSTTTKEDPTDTKFTSEEPPNTGLDEQIETTTVSEEFLVDPPQEESTPNSIQTSEEDIILLSKLVYGEARGVKSKTEQACVIWCVLNRVDSEYYPNTIKEVILQPGQFYGYSIDFPVTEDIKSLVIDVVLRWEQEKYTGEFTGRVLPVEYLYFSGDGVRNYFRDRAGNIYDYYLSSPYEN